MGPRFPQLHPEPNTVSPLLKKLLHISGGGVGVGDRLEVLVELVDDAVEEADAVFSAGDGVGFAGVELEVVALLRLDELLDVLDGVGGVDVVVAGAVADEEMAV